MYVLQYFNLRCHFFQRVCGHEKQMLSSEYFVISLRGGRYPFNTMKPEWSNIDNTQYLVLYNWTCSLIVDYKTSIRLYSTLAPQADMSE